MIDAVVELNDHVFALCPPAGIDTGEKRNSPRFPWIAEIVLTPLAVLEEPEQPQQVFHGHTEDIAKGGIGVLCNRLLPPGTVVRCEIAIPNQAVHIPTLLKVRWTGLLEKKKRYRAGLQFLI
jgi:hypothetical protein